MRVRIVEKPSGVADGIDLGRFVVGLDYDVGTTVGNLLLASGWAAPVESTEPALLIPLTNPIAERLGPPRR